MLPQRPQTLLPLRTLSSPSSKKPLTPLQQAALDAREEEDRRRDLAERLRNSEQNEHISQPGMDLESAIDVIADQKIRKAMGASGVFSELSHRRGQKLDERRPVGDVMGTAGVVPPWLEERKRIDDAVAAIRTAGKLSDEALAELRAVQRKYNRSCPPQFQQPLSSRETLFSCSSR